MIHAHSEYLRGPSQQTAWFYLVTEGACDIYGQSYDLFLRLQDEEQAWQGRDPATVVGERSLRFAACALLDVCRECQCAPPLPDVVIATVRVMDELVNGTISQLDESGVLNTGQWLIANGWSRPGTEAVASGGRKASSDHRIGASSMADLSYGEWRVIWLGGMLVIGAIGAASAGEGPIAVLVMLGGAALIFFLIRRRLR